MLQGRKCCFEFCIHNSFDVVIRSCINENVIFPMSLYKLCLGEMTIFSRKSGLVCYLPLSGKEWLADSSLNGNTIFDRHVYPLGKVRLLIINLFDTLCCFCI